MQIKQINTFNFLELNEKAQNNVISWLDEEPLEYETEDGKIKYQFFYEGSLDDVSEHCHINGYLFDQYGNPIHDLILD